MDLRTLRKLTAVAFVVMILGFLILPLSAYGQGTEPVPATNPGTNLSTYEQQYQSQILQLQAELDALALRTDPADNGTIATILGIVAELLSLKLHEPASTAPAAQASGQAQATGVGNAAGDVARDQAITAIDYASRFMKNFTTEKGNKWNRLRDEIFVPIALLLLLPGAILTQVKAIVSAGAPVVGQTMPFEGIQRALIAMFLIPGTYLIVNYGIDFANSVQYTVATEYHRLFGTDMYKDAICAEIRAFGVRYLPENEGSLNTPPPDQSATNNGPFSQTEGRLWGKLEDPCAGLRRVPANRDDASMPASAIAARTMMNATNASINTCWAILCAFQMAFFYYLYFVGPIMAALWVWPQKQFRDAFPSWVDGVITLCFWSLFWHTTILLMACFKGTDDTGLFIMSALNFLATACVKHAFDFGGLVRAAGAKAAEIIEKAGKEGGGGGGGGGSSSNANPDASTETGGNQQMPPIFVTQSEVPASADPNQQDPGPTLMFLDNENDGWVDGIWNPDTQSYDAAPQGLFLVSTTMSNEAVDNGLPPLAVSESGAPPVMIASGGRLAFLNSEGEYTIPTEYSEAQNVEVPKYVIAADGRVAMWNGSNYIVPQIDTGNGIVDQYQYDPQGYLLSYDSSTGQYVPLSASLGTTPPPNDNTVTSNYNEAGVLERNSIDSLIGVGIQPVFALPVASTSSPTNNALSSALGKANAPALGAQPVGEVTTV